ncbi:MAG TPA: hypothetical protein VJ986_00015 [Gaiellaceae bacterium]|nr:hypothetical protein [Gaiellaceae bacterium]
MTTLESELAELLRATGFAPRQARALSARLGWDGNGGTTLAAAAATEGYTRERVRQLEELARRRFARWCPLLTVTQRALDAIAAVAPARRSEVATRLAAAGLTEGPFDPYGALRAAELVGLEPRVRLVDDMLLSPDDAELTDVAITAARQLTRRSGAADLGEISAVLVGSNGPVEELRRLLGLRREVVWLDAGHRWLTLRGQWTTPERRLRKMLAVSPVLRLADVEDGLQRTTRPVRLPREILRAFCASLDWLDLDSATDTLAAAVPLDPARYLSPLEQELVALVRQAGPVVRLSRAARLAERAGLNPTSVTLYLSQSPAIQTVSRGRYAVRGETLVPAA